MSYNYLPRLEEYNELVHKKIHQGLFFNTFYAGTLNANSSINLCIFTPNNGNYMHVGLPDLSITNDIMKVTWHRGGTTTGGTDLTIINNNDNSNQISNAQAIKVGCTLSNPGAIIKQYYVIGGNKVPSTNKQGYEYILRPDTKYVLTLENIGNSSMFYSYERNWYETDEFYPYSTPNEY